jgi:hypothetical protein
MKKSYLILTLLLLNNSFLNAQAIDKSKKELNSNKSKNTQKSNNSDSSYVDSEDVGLFLEVFGYITLGVFKYGLIGDYNNENHLHNNLNSYPFSPNGRGNYSETDTLRTTNFRLDLEDHYLTGGNSINGNHLDVKIRPSKYFY